MIPQGWFYGIFYSLGSLSNILSLGLHDKIKTTLLVNERSFQHKRTHQMASEEHSISKIKRKTSNFGEYQIVRRVWKNYYAKGTYLEVEGEDQDRSMINFIPAEVLIEILARLPVKSLLLFRSVSKYWRDILKEPTFITKHHRTQTALNHGNCVLVKYRCYDFINLFIKFGLLTEDEQGIKCTRLDLPFLKDFDIRDYDVAGPCNGIVLLSNSRYGDDQYEGCDDLFLWNPATGRYKDLPPSSVLATVKSETKFCFGFGMDPNTKDFKVVRIWEYEEYEGNYAKDCYKVEVISLSASSCKPESESWRIIDAVPPSFPVENPDQLYLNGKHYWCIQDPLFCDVRPCRQIMWFDMAAEVFGLIELPYLCSNPYWHRFGVLKGSLAMIRHAYMAEETKCMYEIWIMDECDGVSWTKYATVGPFVAAHLPLGSPPVDGHLPLGFWKDEELVVSKPTTDGYGEVVFYDIKTNMMKKRKPGLHVEDSQTLLIYSESLVSVAGEN